MDNYLQSAAKINEINLIFLKMFSVSTQMSLKSKLRQCRGTIDFLLD